MIGVSGAGAVSLPIAELVLGVVLGAAVTYTLLRVAERRGAVANRFISMVAPTRMPARSSSSPTARPAR
jgi:hypothetical protein